jgi:hypothetical protein
MCRLSGDAGAPGVTEGPIPNPAADPLIAVSIVSAPSSLSQKVRAPSGSDALGIAAKYYRNIYISAILTKPVAREWRGG